jgi:L-amino acid N-acyltransferase YncA
MLRQPILWILDAIQGMMNGATQPGPAVNGDGTGKAVTSRTMLMPAIVHPTVTSLYIAPAPSHVPVDPAGSQISHLALTDGTNVPFRPIVPADATALQRFHEKLSETSVHMRFFNFMPRLSDAMAHRFTNLDGQHRFALVALDPDDPAEIIGVLRFDRAPGTTDAEYAAVIADRWQGRGLGTKLSKALIDSARARGVKTLTADVLPEIARMLRLFRDLGYPVTVNYTQGVANVRIAI